MQKSEFLPSKIPPGPGIYVFRDRFGEVIYVGKAVNLRRRVSSYFQPSRLSRADAKLRSLIHSIEDFSIEEVRSEDEALILESRLIKAYAPYYNILMRDDKRYLLLKIDLDEPIPTFRTARLKKNDNARYFGPFPNGSALKSTLEFLLRRFQLRSCRSSEPNEETRKHCLKRFVKDCCAPCTGAVTREEYMEHVNRALNVLNGDIAPLTAELQEQMKQAAAEQKFEKAAALRDIMTNLEAVFGRHNREFVRPELPGGPPGEAGVFFLKEVLKLPAMPEWIVGFDNSNLLGKLAVSSMVSFKNGKPDRSNYRRYRVKTVQQADDFATMKEVLTRSIGRMLAEKKPLPDLIMVDGGKGQLSAAIDALVAIDCPPLPVIGLAEKNEEIFLPGRSEPVVLDRHNPALRMLQSLRDEAHRFAITYHRDLRNKLIEQSQLDDIEGIGDTRKKQLLRAFGSVRELRKSTTEEICRRVPGIGKELAGKVLDNLTRGKTPHANNRSTNA